MHLNPSKSTIQNILWSKLHDWWQDFLDKITGENKHEFKREQQSNIKIRKIEETYNPKSETELSSYSFSKFFSFSFEAWKNPEAHNFTFAEILIICDDVYTRDALSESLTSLHQTHRIWILQNIHITFT